MPSYADSRIALIAPVKVLVLVTRNTEDFADLIAENWFDPKIGTRA